jgi:hypothetical protein
MFSFCCFCLHIVRCFTYNFRAITKILIILLKLWLRLYNYVRAMTTIVIICHLRFTIHAAVHILEASMTSWLLCVCVIHSRSCDKLTSHVLCIHVVVKEKVNIWCDTMSVFLLSFILVCLLSLMWCNVSVSIIAHVMQC